MPTQETLIYEEPGVKFSNLQATIGRYAYRMSEITGVRVHETRGKRSVPILIFSVATLVMAYFAFKNVLGVLLILIVMAPSLIGQVRPRTVFALEVDANGETTRPVVSLNESEVSRLSTLLEKALEEARQRPPQAYQLIDEPTGYTPSGAEGNFVRTVPKNCAKCDTPLTVQAIEWQDANHGTCPACGAEVEVTWRKG